MYKIVASLLAVLSMFFVLQSSAFAAAPPPALILVPEDVTRPVVADAPDYVVAPDMGDFAIDSSEQITPITLITVAQSEQLIYDTFTLAASIFSAMLTIIAMGAGIALGFRISREVRGFLSGS